MSSNDILDLNNLIYVADSNASVALNRVQRKFYPEKSNYKQLERIAITIHGNQFLDFKNSSLRLLVTPSRVDGAPGSGTWGNKSSVCNLFNRVRVVSQDGVALTDVTNLNLFRVVDSKLKESSLFKSVVGVSYGYNGNYGNGVTQEYTIPMRMLSPLFDVDQLLAPQISDGMTIELYLENPAIAFDAGGVGANPDQYSIDNVELLVDSSLVQDDTRNTIEQMGFKNNDDFVYEFTDVVNSLSYAPIGSDSIYFEAPQSLSNALEAITVLRNADTVNNTNLNSFNTLGPLLGTTYSLNDEMWYSLGSNKYPQQPAIGGARIYQQILHSQGVLQSKTCDRFDINLEDIETTSGVYPVNLRTSKIFDNSGRTLSNSQRLSIYLRRFQTSVSDESYVLNMFIYYTARIVIKGGKLSIEI
jgi:hypothetical protein